MITSPDMIILVASLVTILVFMIFDLYSKRKIEKEIESLINQLEETNKRLFELDQNKTNFISIASHQLRGPLVKIMGYSSMVLDGDFGDINEKTKEAIIRINHSAEVLNNLVNEFLDVSKLEKNEIDYEISEHNVIDVIEEVTDKYESIIKVKGLDLHKTYNKDDNLKVRIDRQKLSRVIDHILDNAIKYTVKGNISISISKNQNKCLITIKDTGIGIDKSEIPNLFKKFKRSQNANSVSIEGSGLGLFIAKKIMEDQNASIWIDSLGVGKGATVSLEIPLVSH